jgi:hypothetical protein
MKHILFLLITIPILVACNNSTTGDTATTPPPPADSVATAKGYFPIAGFIAGEIRFVDSLQLPLLKIVTIKNEKKQLPVSDAEFKELAKHFTEPDISSRDMRDFYTESSMVDQGVVTLEYTASDRTLPVQKASVYIRQNSYGTDKVTGIYIEKVFNRADTMVREKMYWKAARNLQIITEKQVNNKMLPTEQVKIVWDPTD